MNIVSFTTPAKNFHIHTFNSDAATFGNVSRTITKTKPTNTTGRVVLGSPPNYMKIRMALGNPYDSTNGIEIYLVGWNFCADNMTYVPQVLYYSTGTTQTSAVTGSGIPGGSYYEVGTWDAPIQGDAKIFNPIGVLSGGASMLVVDTMGCEYIEVYVNCGTTTGVRPVYLAVSGF